VGGKGKAIELLAKILHHVIALGLAVHEHIEPKGLLFAHAQCNLVAHGLLVGGGIDLAAFETLPGLTDRPGLWK